MKITLIIDDDLAAELARQCRVRGKKVEDLANDALRRGLKELRAPAVRRFRTRAFDTGGLLVSNVDDIGEVLARVEGEWHR